MLIVMNRKSKMDSVEFENDQLESMLVNEGILVIQFIDSKTCEMYNMTDVHKLIGVPTHLL